MRRLLAPIWLALWLAFAPLAPTPSLAADFLVRSPSLAALDIVAQRVGAGLWVSSSTAPDGSNIPGHVGAVHGLPGVGEWALTPPFQWLKPTGETTTDAFGNVVPVMASDGYWYWILRWNADFAALNPYIAAGGGTVSTVGGVTTITAGAVTMTTPVPSGVPLSF